MRNKHFIIIVICIAMSIHSFAQNPPVINNNLLPVKVNQKWGFIDTLGKIKIEPTFDNLDVLNTLGKKYFIVAEDKKIGLLDRNGQRILQSKYRRVRPLSDDYFAVIQDSLEIVVDRSGTKILDAEFNYIDILNPQYFAFKEDKLWGLYMRNTGEILEPIYDKIIPIKTGKGYFKIMKRKAKNEFWGLSDLNGNIILKTNFKNVDVITDDRIVYKNDSLWGMIDKNGQEVLKPEWIYYLKMSDYFTLWTHKDGSRKLFLHETDSFLVSDNNYISFSVHRLASSTIYAHTTFKVGLLDSLGNVIFPPRFSEFSKINDRLYKVKNGGWGLYDLLQDSLILDTEYTKVGDFESNGYARLYLGDYQGLTTQQGKVVILPVYNRLKLVDGTLKAYENDDLTIFKQNAQGGFDLNDSFENVGVLRIGGNGNSKRTVQRVTWQDPYKFANYKWERNRGSLWGLKDLTTKKWVIQPKYGYVKVIHKANITLVYQDTLETSIYLKSYTNQEKEQFHSVGIFSHESMTTVSNIDMVGIRARDFIAGSSTAAFMSKEGKFGLIHKKGYIVLPPTKLYIGTYSQGLFVFPKGKTLGWNFNENRKSFASSWSIVSSFNLKLMYRSSGERVFPDLIIENGRWGYMNETGKVIIPPQFFFHEPFQKNGVIINRTATGWGMMDAKGKTLIPFEYATIYGFGKNKLVIKAKNNNIITLSENGRAMDSKYIGQGTFKEGFARVAKRDKSEKLIWGFVNTDFEEIIPCQYKKVKNFENGIAAVYDSAWHFINTSGKIVTTLHKAIREIGSFHEGLAWARIGSTNYGYINMTGQFVIKPTLTKAGNFSKMGVASAVRNNQAVIIDTRGVAITENGLYSQIFDISEHGLAKVKHPRRRLYGVINYMGEEVIPILYDQISPFTDGIAVIRKQGKSGFVDSSGHVIVEPKYDNSGLPAEGLIPVFVALGKTWHYIDYQGKVVIKGDFKTAESFFNGYAIVTIEQIQDGQPKTVTALIDKKGTFQFISTPSKSLKHYANGYRGIQTTEKSFADNTFNKLTRMYYADDNNYNIFGKTFNEIKPFENDLGLVITDDGWGAINSQGFVVIPNKYIRLIRTDNGTIRGKSRFLYGLADFTGQIVQPIDFDKIQLIQPRIYRVERDGKIGYITETGEWIWEIQE